MEIRKGFFLSGLLLVLFILLTGAVLKVDVQTIGPDQSQVGLATINQFVFEKIGVHLVWYTLTDLFGILAILVASGFGMLGFTQFIRRRNLLKLDADILLLGVLYLIIIGIYVFFERTPVNYRPIILDSGLEASFPSSHAMIVLCIMATAIVQFRRRIRKSILRMTAQYISVAVIIMTVAGRLISGVHWLTDIVAGILLGAALTLFYVFSLQWIDQKLLLRTHIKERKPIGEMNETDPA